MIKDLNLKIIEKNNILKKYILILSIYPIFTFGQFENSKIIKFPNSFPTASKTESISISSLKSNFYQTVSDTSKVKLLIEYIDTCYNISIWKKINDYALSFIELKFQNDLNIKEKMFYQLYYAHALNNKGYEYGETGKIQLQLKYYQKALDFYKKVKNIKGISIAENNIGYVYDKKGMINLALEFYFKSLKNKELINDSIGIANTQANLAFNYLKLNNLDKAEYFFLKSYRIRNLINDEQGIINSLNHLGNIYLRKFELYKNKEFKKKALDNYLYALKLSNKNNDDISLCETLTNLGNFYQNEKNFTKALEYYFLALEKQFKCNDKKGEIQTNKSISSLFYSKNELKKSEIYANKAFIESKKMGFPQEISETAFQLYQIYRKINKVDKALYFHEEFLKMRDSFNNSFLIQKNLELNIQYEYDKKKYADSIVNAEKQKISNLKIKAQNAEIKQKKTLNYSLIIGLVLLIGFIYLVFKKYKTEKLQKEIIQKQKKIVNEQKIIVEEQHKEITDSIKYAERIQGAILPPDQKWLQILPNSFVLNKPKDILSGDFYWIAQTDEHIFVAAADCTGHGVPGALISIVNFNLLNKAVLERDLTKPSDILDAVNIWLTESLNQTVDGSTIKDGMDISLLSFNKRNGEILYAGANNPLYWFHKNELIEIKADKFPVGAFIDEKVQKFTTKEIPAQFGDTLYLFSDGFADQFGGPFGKKYKYKQLKEKLFEIIDESMDKQKLKLEIEFRSWKGEYEQTDDVLIIGIKVNSHTKMI